MSRASAPAFGAAHQAADMQAPPPAQPQTEPLAKKTADQIEKETMNNRISNDERRVSNQGILSVLFFKEQSEATSTIRNSLFDILRFSV